MPRFGGRVQTPGQENRNPEVGYEYGTFKESASSVGPHVHRDTHGRYGNPRIHVELKAQGRGASRTPLRHRLYQPDRDGAKSSLTLSIFSGEDHRRRLTTKLTPSYFRTGSIPHPMGLVRFALSSRRIVA